MDIRRSTSAVACLAMLIASAVGPAGASPTTLTPEQQLLTWSGSFNAEHIITPVPDLRCVEGACDTFAFDVALGGGFWAPDGGAVEVAIRWVYDGVIDLDLAVHDADGNEVARSEAVDSDAESVFIPELADGSYTATVIPTNTVNPDGGPDAYDYEGLVQVERAPPAGEGADLLPDLVSLPPHNFHVSTAANLLPFPENPLMSCYAEETLEDERHPTKCLRFDQTIANTGDGKLELRFALDGALTDPRMIQRIYTDDGGSRDRLADEYELHAVHGHVHYKGFDQSILYPYQWGVGRTGDGTSASEGSKVGFCVIDVVLLADYWAATGNGPRAHTFPTCNFPTEADENAWMVQGIDVGWADVYGWNLADQYIDITGVPDGVYELEQLANPNHSILESDPANNTASTIICIAGDVVTEVRSAAEADACATSPY